MRGLPSEVVLTLAPAYDTSSDTGFEYIGVKLMSSTDAFDQLSKAPQRGIARAFRFPILWPLLLGIICAVVWNSTEDQGLANTMIHFAVILAVFGWSFWIILGSGWNIVARYLSAGLMLLLLSSVYFQFGPIELITNGDVGVEGWRWRWADPDRDLDVQTKTNLAEGEIRTTEYDYPRFLGTGYWAEVSNVQIDSDWDTSPPQELWRQKIGAGWSSFAVVGNHAFTQEQRGESEMVRCYELETGELI